MAHGSGNWTARDVPDQHGRTVVITGANSGIGLAAARVLAARGARVVLAGRDPAGRPLPPSRSALPPVPRRRRPS